MDAAITIWMNEDCFNPEQDTQGLFSPTQINSNITGSVMTEIPTARRLL